MFSNDNGQTELTNCAQFISDTDCAVHRAGCDYSDRAADNARRCRAGILEIMSWNSEKHRGRMQFGFFHSGDTLGANHGKLRFGKCFDDTNIRLDGTAQESRTEQLARGALPDDRRTQHTGIRS